MVKISRLSCLLSLVSSNFLTAVVVYIFIADCPRDERIPRHINLPSSSLVAHHQNSYHSTQDIFTYFNQSLGGLANLVDNTSPMKVVKTNCSLPPKPDSCSYVQFEALLNIVDKTVCKCEDSRLSVGSRCDVKGQSPETLHRDKKSPDTSLQDKVSPDTSLQDKVSPDTSLQDKVSPDTSHRDKVSPPDAGPRSNVSIFAVTPTYTRYTQKVDLISLCYIIENVPNLIWIVVEDSDRKTDLVANLLKRCKVRSVHLHAKTSSVYKVLKSRGVEQRNTGLSWIREHCQKQNELACSRGVLYFMDDDNKYDLRLFEEMKKTKVVSVLPVAFSGGLKYEGPICDSNGKVTKWRAHYAPERTFPMDMAGFAIHITHFLAKPDVKMGFTLVKGRRKPVKEGHLETDYLENFATRTTVECRGPSSEVLVWHVKTLKPPLPYEAKHIKDKKLET